MTREIPLPFLCVAVAVLAGCEPRERIAWSPDGSAAAVLASDGLRLCDGDGKLSDVQLKDVEHARWAKGKGERLLVVQRHGLATWDALLPYLTPKARHRVMADANSLLAEVRAWKGAPEKLELKAAPADFAASLVYLRETHEKELAAKFGGKWGDVKDASRPLYVVRLCERKADGKFVAGAELARTLQEIEEIRPSRDGHAYAFVAKGDVLAGEDANALSLFSGTMSQGGKLTSVADDVAKWFDWSGDGHIVYVAAEGPAIKQKGSLRMGVLRAARRDVARVVFSLNTRVRVLGDGSMLLATEDWKAPSPPRTAKESEAMAIYRLDPNGQNIRPIAAVTEEMEKLKSLACLFEPSPDGTMISVPTQGLQVFVVSLADGKVIQAQGEAGPQGSMAPIVPAWRSAKELCLGVPRKGESRLDIALWTRDSGTKAISGDWPEAVVKGWLIQEQPNAPSQPASAPAAKLR